MPLLHTSVSLNLGVVVVIPAYDEPYLLLCLMNLKKCALPECDVEVIVIINHSEAENPLVKKNNLEIFEKVKTWSDQNSTHRLKFQVVLMGDLPKKFAGVGMARKVGMDEAAWRFEKIRQPGGVIACFDADSRCDKNYLTELYRHFSQNPKINACSVYFEHPTEGAEFEADIYEAITHYELHLRYYVNAQRWSGFPHAYQTIGSSMAVRCSAYQEQGGMNKRKAGEDFYFLQKFIELGNFSELNSTRVLPSPRKSDRVPFGTGKAVAEILDGKQKPITYNPLIFQDLKIFFESVFEFYNIEKEAFAQKFSCLPDTVQSFLKTVDFEKNSFEINKHTNSPASFHHRFFRWFNAFMLMKFVHYARDNFYPNVPVREAASWLAQNLDGFSSPETTEKELLQWFRMRDKAGWRQPAVTFQ